MYLSISNHLRTILGIVLGAGLQRQKTSAYSHEPYEPTEWQVYKGNQSCVLSVCGRQLAAMTTVGWWVPKEGGAWVRDSFLACDPKLNFER